MSRLFRLNRNPKYSIKQKLKRKTSENMMMILTTCFQKYIHEKYATNVYDYYEKEKKLFFYNQ